MITRVALPVLNRNGSAWPVGALTGVGRAGGADVEGGAAGRVTAGRVADARGSADVGAAVVVTGDGERDAVDRAGVGLDGAALLAPSAARIGSAAGRDVAGVPAWAPLGAGAAGWLAWLMPIATAAQPATPSDARHADTSRPTDMVPVCQE